MKLPTQQEIEAAMNEVREATKGRPDLNEWGPVTLELMARFAFFQRLRQSLRTYQNDCRGVPR